MCEATRGIGWPGNRNRQAQQHSALDVAISRSITPTNTHLLGGEGLLRARELGADGGGGGDGLHVFKRRGWSSWVGAVMTGAYVGGAVFEGRSVA
jgi:hypothetical protein